MMMAPHENDFHSFTARTGVKLEHSSLISFSLSPLCRIRFSFFLSSLSSYSSEESILHAMSGTIYIFVGKNNLRKCPLCRFCCSLIFHIYFLVALHPLKQCVCACFVY